MANVFGRKYSPFSLIIVAVLVGAFLTLAKITNQLPPPTSLTNTAIYGNEVGLELAYSTKELQLYGPQCLPSTNNNCHSNLSFLARSENPGKLVISLFSYYKDDQIATIADYHKYLVENNFGTEIEYVKIGKPNDSITAIHFIPTVELKEDIALPTESYAIVGENNSLFLIRLYDSNYSDIFNAILASFNFRK